MSTVDALIGLKLVHRVAQAMCPASLALSSLVLGRTVQFILLYFWTEEKSQNKDYLKLFFNICHNLGFFVFDMQHMCFYLKDDVNDRSTKLFCFSTGLFNAIHTFFRAYREIVYGITAHKKIPPQVHAAEF
jgi:hypothetical protein